MIAFSKLSLFRVYFKTDDNVKDHSLCLRLVT